jgi:two-component system sensor kinase FixL
MNACDAMGNLPMADRKVTIATQYLPGTAFIEVTMSDNGCGIAAADLERIFQPFVTTKPGGMGMGLAICRSVAEQHGGRLHAGNAPGGGAVFRLEIPVGGSLS